MVSHQNFMAEIVVKGIALTQNELLENSPEISMLDYE